MAIQNTDCWVDDTLHDANCTSEKKTKDLRHHELYNRGKLTTVFNSTL